jgi:hypothetical protein
MHGSAILIVFVVHICHESAERRVSPAQPTGQVVVSSHLGGVACRRAQLALATGCILLAATGEVSDSSAAQFHAYVPTRTCARLALGLEAERPPAVLVGFALHALATAVAVRLTITRAPGNVVAAFTRAPVLAGFLALLAAGGLKCAFLARARSTGTRARTAVRALVRAVGAAGTENQANAERGQRHCCNPGEHSPGACAGAALPNATAL